MKNEFRILPLSEKTLKDASKLTVRVFRSNSKDEDYPPRWFKASLNPEKNKESYNEFDVRDLKYWVAVDREDVVVGVVGYYTLEYDEE